MGEYAVAKTSVWWDIENCCVPRSCDPQLIVQNMSSALAAAGYRGAISVSAYGDTHQISHNVQHALSSTGVSLHHVPAGIKDASDKKILVDMLFWAIDNPPPANYLLISGDRDFSNAIHKLKMRRYNILLAQPPNVSQTLTSAAKSVWLWKSLVAGEPPLAKSPYISCTSTGNKDDLDKSKNIVSSSSGVTQDTSGGASEELLGGPAYSNTTFFQKWELCLASLAKKRNDRMNLGRAIAQVGPNEAPPLQDTNPEVQNILCDPQSDANSKADKKYEVLQPREMEADNVSIPTRKQKKRSNPGGSEFAKQTAFKKSKGGFQSTEQSKLKQPKIGQGMICLKCGVVGHRPVKCTYIGVCRRCGKGHMERVCKENPASIIKWEQVPAYRPSQGQGMICLKCGIVGHRAAKCTYIGVCRRCGQGHMERVCQENPDSIIKWEKVHAYALAMSSQGLVHMAAPASQLPPTRTPPPGSLWQVTPAVPTPSPGPATPASPHTGVAASSPTQSGVYATPTAASFGKPYVVTQPTSSAPRPPMELLVYQPVLGQYHQVGTSQMRATWTPPPGSLWQATPAVPTPSAAPAPPHTGVAASSSPAQSGVNVMPTAESLGKPDVVTQPTSSTPRPPTELLAYQQVLGQYQPVGTSQLLPAWTPPPGYFSLINKSPFPALLAAPVPPQLGIAASRRPAHSGFFPMPFPFGRPW